MSKSFENDTKELCNFLKEHDDVTDIDVSSGDNTLILNLNTAENSQIDWTFIREVFEQYFNVSHSHNIEFNCNSNKKQKVYLENDDIMVVSKPKQPIQPIATFSTEKNDWKLFRFYSQSGKSFEDNYYEPREEIARKEISNLEDVYEHILRDMKNKVFTRNIIELNVNCLNSNELKGLYIEALRRLPIQLKNRIAISLVRIPKAASVHVLRQAALICKLCTDNIFLSFPFQSIPDREKLNQIYGVMGYVVTVPKDEVKNFEDIKRIYDRLNALFPNKKAFVIFNNDKDYGASYRSSKVIRLYERDKIGVV